MQQKKVLNDVIILRPLAILLLVVYHSFIIYRGGWRAPADFHEIKAYWWVATASYSFMLELFVLMSGYVLGFQMLELNKEYTLKYLFFNKFKRLIVPSIVFSIIYYTLFRFQEPFNPIMVLYDVLCGIGHLWFLPMLFWCFIGAYLLLLLKVRDGLKIALCVCMSLISFLPLPFGMGQAMYYLFFFYLGVILYKNRQKFLDKMGSKGWILFCVAYLITFICFTLLKEKLNFFPTNSLITKAISLMFSKTMTVIYATLGSMFFWLLTNTILQKKTTIPIWIIAANGLCFGVYIFQQFILKILYYKTQIPIIVGAYWLPVVGFVITMFISASLAFLTRKTKIGKFLIG